jgi:hypothetical protein
MNNKIGIGIVTYNAPAKIKQSAFSVSGVDEFVIVNDGQEYSADCYPKGAVVIQHSKNLKVAQTKNDALKYLMDKGCEHIFLMEDDVIIKDCGVFTKYIEASRCSGIRHLNFAYQGPYNYKAQINEEKKEGLLARTFNEKEAIPDPLVFINYDKANSIALHRACVGAFSYFHRRVIESSGYFDVFFQNSWEHIEHTYRIIKDGFHPPFGWFADIKNSRNYIDNIENCMENSSIAKDPQWKKNSVSGEEYFKKKYGFGPTKIPKTNERGLMESLNEIYKNRDKNLYLKKNKNDFQIADRTGKYFPDIEGILWFNDGGANQSAIPAADQNYFNNLINRLSFLYNKSTKK